MGVLKVRIPSLFFFVIYWLFPMRLLTDSGQAVSSRSTVILWEDKPEENQFTPGTDKLYCTEQHKGLSTFTLCG